MPGLIAVVAQMPADADLRLMEPGPVPIAIIGGEAHTFPGNGADSPIPLDYARQLDKIERAEFFTWLTLRGTRKFLIAGVPIAVGGYAGERGTAFVREGPRALTSAEREAIESGATNEVEDVDFVAAMLRGASRTIHLVPRQ